MQQSGGRRWLWIGIALAIIILIAAVLLVSVSPQTGDVLSETQTALDASTRTAEAIAQQPTELPGATITQEPSATSATRQSAQPTFPPTASPSPMPSETAAIGADEPTETPSQIDVEASPPPATRTALPVTQTATQRVPEALTAESQLETSAPPTETESSDSGEQPEEPTESPTPVEVAAAFFEVRDVSGGVIGSGTLRVFAPEKVQPAQTVRVELELRIDSRYITPTPVPIDSQPGTPPGGRRTATPRPGRPTPTPREPTFEESGLAVYQRMGASLICAESSFAGCDKERPDAIEARLISINGMSWSWILSPQENARGLQDLELRLWKLISVDGAPAEPEIVWTHGFRIDVSLAGGGMSGVPIGAVLGVGALALAAVLGVTLVLRRGKRAPLVPSIGNRPSVFISYRRRSTFADAMFVSQELQKAGADVFIDIEDIHEGRFADIIEKAIREREFFVPVLAPDTLESDWVRKEITFAIEQKKRIIPVLVRGFTLDALPDDVKELGNYNAVTIMPEFVRAAIDKLLRFMELKT